MATELTEPESTVPIQTPSWGRGWVGGGGVIDTEGIRREGGVKMLGTENLFGLSGLIF